MLTSRERARDLKQGAVNVVATQGGGQGAQIATDHYGEDLSVMARRASRRTASTGSPV